MTHLLEASKQWASRPDDQRFWTIQEMHGACKQYAEDAAVASVRYGDIEAAEADGDLVLLGKQDVARFTNWSFGQLSSRVGAPAGYLRQLPATLAADNINHGLQRIADDEAKLLMHRNGSLVCRAFTSDEYSRIWNYEVLERLLRVEADGWRVPPGRPANGNTAGNGCRLATADDVLNQPASAIGIKVGDPIAAAGLYASDHDMFAFLVNDTVRIDDGSEGGLGRGVFVSNSEVGASALKVTRFLYRYVCGNHIVWDASDVSEIKIVHRGKADETFRGKLSVELTKYANESGDKEVSLIQATKRMLIGSTKDEVLDALFTQRRLLPRKTLEMAYESAETQATDFSPNSVWGMVQGITRIAQDEVYAENRVALDRVAGKLMSIEF